MIPVPVTLDSSVIVASLLELDPRHREACDLMDSVFEGSFQALEPLTVLVEVAAAVRRRTGSPGLAREVGDFLATASGFSFLPIDHSAAEEAVVLASRTGLRGMDALVFQVAHSNGIRLVTFDGEMAAKTAAIP